MKRKKRRKGPPRLKRGWLRVGWGYTREMGEDLYFCSGPGVERCDSRLLANVLTNKMLWTGKTIVEELETRGYDLRTLRFEIQLKKVPEGVA